MAVPYFKAGRFQFQTPLKFAKNPLVFIEKGFEECGDTFLIKLLRFDFLVSRDPAYFKHVLQQNNKNYVKPRAVLELKKALGNGLITSDGDFWLRQRRLAQPAFHRERLSALFKTMGNITTNFLDEMEQHRNGAAIDIDEKMMGITADIALKTLFSTITNEDKGKIYRQINRSQEHIINRVRQPYLIPWLHLNGAERRFKADIAFFDSMVYDIIKKRRASKEEHNDLLQLLLDSTDEDTGEQMNDVQIRDETTTMFAAGHETSANGLNWLLLELSKRPEIVAKIREEAALFDNVPTFEQLMQLTYTKQVVEEGLRLYPPAWALGRQPIGDDEVNSYKFDKKTSIFLSIYGLHRNPSLWPNPHHFDPENFSVEKVKNRSKFDYLPFGAGPRYCIGQQFAMMEMQLILPSLLKRFTFESDPSHQPELLPLIALKPKNGIKMFIK